MNTNVIKVRDEVALKIQKLFQNFISKFSNDDGKTFKYSGQCDEFITEFRRNTFTVSFEDVLSSNETLAAAIHQGYNHLYPYLCSAIRNVIEERTDASDMRQKSINERRQIFVAITDVPSVTAIRHLRPSRLGRLTKVVGQVVRAHPVHPELVLGTFVCIDCQTVIKDVVQQFKYTQPTICTNPACGNRRKFTLDLHKSHFVDFQRLRVQETQSELPRGETPRSLEIIIRGDAVECAQAGDQCAFFGCPVVVPDLAQLNLPGAVAEPSRNQKDGGGSSANPDAVGGLKSLGVRQLNYRMSFLAAAIVHTNRRVGLPSAVSDNWQNEEDAGTGEDLEKLLTQEQWESVYQMSKDRHLFDNLQNSLFPTLMGNDEVKRGILLQLFGGVPKRTDEGVRLRGDINICIIGDPSTGKSQLLKTVERFCPRAVYTSGKSSSAAGLTAAVGRDEETGDFVIEAGALMLADNGVCCIDEFDKMDVKDQVAIHEAMEQQTISIAKAGVKATLNARASVLAAANPINGRYDRTKPLRYNIQLSAPILSRFDLFFILLDECNEVVDYMIAKNLVELHAVGTGAIPAMDAAATQRVTYTKDQIQQYILFARNIKPKLTVEAQQYLIDEYTRMRLRDASGKRAAWRITVRQLESMLRLTEAVARLHCRENADVDDAREAVRLLNKSIIRVEQPDINLDEQPLGPIGGSTGNENMETDAPADSTVEAPTKVSKKTVTYDEYRRIASLLVMHLRQLEDQDGDDCGGMRRSKLVEWYLEAVSENIEDMDDLAEKKWIVERVVEKLVKQDRILLELDDVTKKKDGEEDVSDTAEADKTADKIVIVHPNYIPDNR